MTSAPSEFQSAEFKAFAGLRARRASDPNQIGLVAWYHLKEQGPARSA